MDTSFDITASKQEGEDLKVFHTFTDSPAAVGAILSQLAALGWSDMLVDVQLAEETSHA